MGSLILFPLILPFVGLLVCLISWESKGPAIFKQERIGKNSKLYTCYKLRSMYLNAEELLKDYLLQKPHLQREWHQYAKLKETDPRVTKVGRIIRKCSLDELPQVLNVFKGEMSFVGPRPYLPREKSELTGYEEILSVRPGITGYWQVNGRNDVEFSERLRMDQWYVQNWSLFLDFKILLKTFVVVVKRQGAF